MNEARKTSESGDQYRQPHVVTGTAVRYFPGGDPEEGTGYIGLVLSRNLDTSSLLMFSTEHARGVTVNDVPYRDDPRLTDAQKRRERGCWDFTDDAKELSRFKRRLERCMDRLATLEQHAHETSGFKPGYWPK